MEHIENMRQEEEWKQEKLEVRQEQNRLSQQKHCKRIKVQEIQAGMVYRARMGKRFS